MNEYSFSVGLSLSLEVIGWQAKIMKNTTQSLKAL